jgi:hypothetical protein
MSLRLGLLGSLLILTCHLLWAQPEPASTRGPLQLGVEAGVQFTNYRFQTRAGSGSDLLDIRSPYRVGLWLGLPLSWHFHRRWALRLAPALSLERSRVELDYPGDSLAQRLVELYNLVLPLTLQWAGGRLDQPHLLLDLGPTLSLNLRSDLDSLATPDRRAVRRVDGGLMGYLGLGLPLRMAASNRLLSLKAHYRIGLGNVLREQWPIPGISALNQQGWLLSLTLE